MNSTGDTSMIAPRYFFFSMSLSAWLAGSFRPRVFQYSQALHTAYSGCSSSSGALMNMSRLPRVMPSSAVRKPCSPPNEKGRLRGLLVFSPCGESDDVQVLDALVEVLFLGHLAVELDVEAHLVGRIGEA